MNRVELVGRITKDPELRYTSSNVATVRFTLAVNRQFQNQNGERETDFISCVAWRNQAENMKKYVFKGSLISVEGRIQTGSYEKDGQRVYTTDVIADSVQFLESKAQSQNREMGVTPSDFEDNSDSTLKSSMDAQTTDMSEEVFADFGDSIEISDDDIAF